MVRVRIAVGVNEAGEWTAAGWQVSRQPTLDGELIDNVIEMLDPDLLHNLYWLEADLPEPGAVVEARVVE